MTRILLPSIAGALAGLAVVSPPAAQESQPNWDYRFRSEALFDDNIGLSSDADEDGTALITTLGIGNRTQTRVSSFELDVSGHVRVQDIPTQDETTRFDDPRIRLSYDRAVGDDSLSLSFNAREVDIAFLDTLEGNNSLNELDFDDTRGDGSRRTLNGRISGVINADAPLTFNYSLAGAQRRFEDTEDEDDLEDLDQYAANASVLFDITRTVRGVVQVSYDFRDTDDEVETQTRTRSATTGLDLALDDITSLSLRVGYSEVETEEQALGTEETEEGVIASIGLVRLLQDGTATFAYSSNIDENGQRDRLTVGRTVERGDTSFGGTIGVSASEFTDDVRPVGSLFFNQELPRAQIGATLAQEAQTDENGFDAVFTRFNINYEQGLTSDLSFVFDLAAARSFREIDENNETRRLNVSASLRRALTSAWDIDLGYRYRFREGDDGDTSDSNAVFAALVRDLQIRGN